MIDIVTSRQANLHNEMMRLLGQGEEFTLPSHSMLYAIAYRPIVRAGYELIDAWPATLAVGEHLPVLPLALSADLALPLDLEATYSPPASAAGWDDLQGCRDRRILGANGKDEMETDCTSDRRFRSSIWLFIGAWLVQAVLP